MAAPIPEVTDLNFIKIISLLSEIGKDCLLKAFYSVVRKENVQKYFQSDKIQNKIDDLLKRGILVGDQYNKLKDENIKPDEFELAMLFELLRYVVVEVKAPVKNCHTLPSGMENSLGACLLKVQRIRNEVVHRPKVELDDDEFEEKWDDLAHYLRTIIKSVGGEEDSKKVSKKIRELEKTSKKDLSRNLAKNVKQVFLWSVSDITRLQSQLSAGQIRSNTLTQHSHDGLDEPDAVRNDTAMVQRELETITNEFQAISVDELPTQADVLPLTSIDSSHVIQELNDMTRRVNDIFIRVQTLMLRLDAQAPQEQTAQEIHLGSVAQSTVPQKAIYNYGATDSLNIFDGEMTIGGTLDIGSGLGENSLQSVGNNSSGTTSSLPNYSSRSSVHGSSESTGAIVTNVAGRSSINVMGGKLNTAPGSYISIRSNFHCWDLNAYTVPSQDIPDAACSSSSIAGQFKKKDDDCLTQTMMESYTAHMKCVGAIVAYGDIQGTVFRVGHQSLMTALHVVEYILDPDKRGVEELSNLTHENTYVSFTDSPLDQGIRYRLTSDIDRDIDHDIAVLQITNTNDPLPPQMRLRNESIASLSLKFISIIGSGHPEQNRTNNKNFEYLCPLVNPKSTNVRSAIRSGSSRLKQMGDVFKADLIQQGKDPKGVDLGYADYDADFKILFHCFMEHGLSGSPIIRTCSSALDTAASVEVVGVVTHGIPDFFFGLSPLKRIYFPNNERFEAGSKMEHICKYFQITNPPLASELFNIPDVKESDFQSIRQKRETAV